MHRLGWGVSLVFLLAWPSFGTTVRAASPTSAYISSPAYYLFQEGIRLDNPGRTAAQHIVAHVILLPPHALYGQVTLTSVSRRPTRIVRDQNGNTVGIYTLARLDPDHALRITPKLSVVSHAIAYRLPQKTAPYDIDSRRFRLYTNPHFEYRQGVSTDAPTVVRKVTRGRVLALMQPVITSDHFHVIELAMARSFENAARAALKGGDSELAYGSTP